jgi:hypothetical protein
MIVELTKEIIYSTIKIVSNDNYDFTINDIEIINDKIEILCDLTLRHDKLMPFPIEKVHGTYTIEANHDYYRFQQSFYDSSVYARKNSIIFLNIPKECEKFVFR